MLSKLRSGDPRPHSAGPLRGGYRQRAQELQRREGNAEVPVRNRSMYARSKVLLLVD